jgi:hypothetical protein
MANNNNIKELVETNNTQIQAAGLTLPQGFPDSRQPNELELLIQTGNNTKTLYNKYSFNSSAPLNQRPLLQSSVGTRRSNYSMALNDVVRVTKFSLSNNGVQFLTHQLLLQGLNAFNETKLYNPLTPLFAATSKASFGLQDAPIRFIEPTLGGVLGALGLGTVSSLVGINQTPTPPAGTVGASALPKGASDGGKGLIRGKTASDANTKFQSKWPSGVGGGGFFSGLLSSVGNFIRSNTAIGTFFPVGQPNGTTYKVGDKAYGYFLQSSKLYTKNNKTDGSNEEADDQPNIRWFGGTDIRASGQLPVYKTRLFKLATPPSSGNSIDAKSGKSIQQKPTGIPLLFDSNNRMRYENNVGIVAIIKNGDPLTYKYSDMLVNYGYYNDKDQKYPSKVSDKNSDIVKSLDDDLQSVLNNLKKAGYDTQNVTNTKSTDKSIGNPNRTNKGYDELHENPSRYENDFYHVRTLDRTGNNDPNKIMQFGSANTQDYINQLNVLNADSTFIDGRKYGGNKRGNDYSPYEDDIIAFYFHDLVNDKYIPFRATVVGINETLSSDWTDVKYINRADKLFTYGGFTRTLGFKFNVVMSSIKELVPTWQRINYLVGLSKPANYTDGTIYSRFIIPPMIKFTIGDMYKNQPAVITQIGVSIPDNASWETLGEFYSSNNYNWAYLAGNMQWLNSSGLYAQFPNECEINISMNLLEKELPHTGGSNYGDFYRDVSQRNPIGTSKQGSFSSRLEPTSTTATPMVKESSQ